MIPLVDIDSVTGSDPDMVLMTMTPTIGRRVLGAGAMAALGALLVWIAFTSPPALAWQIFLIGFGVFSLWFSTHMWRSSAKGIELTGRELRDTEGTILASVSEITKVEKSAFAFKPSNGLLVRTRDPLPRVFVPGLWWRIGRSVGIGGLTNAGHAKAMAEYLAVLMAVRDRDQGT